MKSRSTDATAVARSTGNDNLIRIDAQGRSNAISVVQTGDENEGRIQTDRGANLSDGTFSTGGSLSFYEGFNTLSIAQTGNEHRAEIVQNKGESNEVTITQMANEQTALVDLRGNDNDFKIDQNTGDQNFFRIEAEVVGSNNNEFNTLDVDQIGASNTSHMLLNGSNNGMSVQQTGNSNQFGVSTAKASVIGDDNTIALTQTGDLNKASLSVLGDDNKATFKQLSSGNTGSITQSGNMNVSTITQN